MYCPNCGAQNVATATMCFQCGSALAPEGAGPFQVAAPPQPVFAGYAGFWKRFAAIFIDNIILGVAGCIVGFIFGCALGLILGASGGDISEVEAMAQLAGNILGIVMSWLYFTLLEASRFQATIGKMALGIKVTDLNGQRISLGRANGRYWSKILSALILMIGFIMAGFTEKKQALHDMIGGTLVVNK